MSSQGQPIFIPLGGGLDTGTDDKLLPVGKVPVLSNCIINRTGEVVKRGGLSALGATSTPGGATIETAWQLATYKNALVNLQLTHSASPFYLYSAVTGQWSKVADPTVTSDAPITSGLRARVAHSLIPVTSSLGLALGPDVAYSAGFYFSCYKDFSTGKSVLRVIDATDGAVVYTWNSSLAGDGQRVIVTNGFLVLLYIDDSAHQLIANTWNISTGFNASLGAPTVTTVATGLSAGSPDRFFDVINAPGVTTACAICYRTNASTTRRADFTPSTSGVVDVEIKTSGGASIATTQAMAWTRDSASSNRLGLITCTAAALQMQWDLTGGTPASTYTLNAAPGPDVRAVAGHTTGTSAGGEFNVIYETYTLGTPTDGRVIRLSIRTSGGAITDGIWVRSVGLTSCTFPYQGQNWVVVNYESRDGLQSSYFLLRVNPTALSNPQPTSPQARIALWNSAGTFFTNRSHLSNVASPAGGQFSAAIQVAVGGLNLTSATGGVPTVATGAGVSIAAMIFDPTLGPAREAAESLYVPGSILSSFLGRSYEEDGFSIYPEQPTATPAAGGSLTANSTYRYQIVYAFSDENGRKHRSTTSVPLDVSIAFSSRLNVDLATLVPLPACTAVGAGAGKYLIENPATGVGVSIDGTKAKEGMTVLVRSEAAGANNGVYTVANAGAPPSAWQLVRSPLYDGSTGHVPLAGDVITVNNVSAAANGATNHGKQFALQGAGPFTIDVSTLTYTATTPTQTINLTIPTLRLTNRAVTIEVYRTQANATGGIPTLVGTVANDTTVDSVSFNDTFSDASIAANAPIYTSGGVLDSQPSPGFSYVFVAKDRLWGISMDNPEEAWFTDEFTPGEAPRWNEERIVAIADEHGPMVAGSPLDDKVVFLKGDAIYATTGDGPNEIGQGGFTDVQLVAIGIGATSPQSIAATKDGIFFGSSSTNVRIKLLDRSLTVEDIGAPIRSLDNIPIVAAGFVPVLDQVRFCLSGKIQLVYDVVEKQWSTFQFADSSVVFTHGTPWNGTYVVATSSATVLTESQNGGLFTDNGFQYPMTILSPWVQLSGIKGFSRLKRIQGVGFNLSVGIATVDVQLFIDFSTTVLGHYTGKPGQAWNWEVVPRVQRGGAFQVQITETSSQPGFRISGVTMQIGTKPGLSRQAATTRLVGQ